MKKFISVFCLIFTLTLLGNALLQPMAAKGEAIGEKVFRLHILANSDSEADQALKLKVRDEVLRMAPVYFQGCSSAEEAAEAAEAHQKEFSDAARRVLAYYGAPYEVRVKVTEEYFNTREYGDFTLPPGMYHALKIIIGAGKGHNWWCVMYPSVCLSGCAEDFEGVLTPEECELIRGHKYILRFKILEVVEQIKSRGKK